MTPALVYLGVAILSTWPTAARLGDAVPGGARTDVWDSLWSLWFVQRALGRGELPWRVDLLGWPDGGVLFVADPVNALIAAPLIAAFGLSVGYSALILGHGVFAGLAAHALGRRIFGAEAAAYVTGVAWALAPVQRAAVENGASEAIAGGWLPLAALTALVAAEEGGARRVGLAGLALFFAAAASWYSGLAAWMVWAGLLLLGRPGVSWRTTAGRLVGVAAVAAALTAPLAYVTRLGVSHKDNLVGIKDVRELLTVRRTVGPADPRGWFIPGDFRSPDFRELSRYAEGFIHCHYLGWSLLIASAIGLHEARRRGERGLGLWALVGLGGAILAMGPVVVMDGQPWILDRRLAVPLPYFLLEGAPGFSGLSLLYRLGMLPALALAVLAGAAVVGRPRLAPGLAALVAVELLWLSPMRGLPTMTSTAVEAPVHWLAEAPDGAVMNFPVVGGRGYLFEQTVHGKPVAASLNFPNNEASRRVWSAAIKAAAEQQTPEQVRRRVAEAARRQKIRYLVVHKDADARPDMHDDAVRAISESFPAAAEGPTVQVYALW
ncbi:hypothetical protein L6R49_00865 [Myxococcota bacterium]|nr:hypothetical protein [Myxococcota bacterium]